MMIAKLAENFTPAKGEIVCVSDRSDNSGKDWYYFAWEQDDQGKVISANSHTTSTGNKISRFLGSYRVTRVYKYKVIISPILSPIEQD